MENNIRITDTHYIINGTEYEKKPYIKFETCENVNSANHMLYGDDNICVIAILSGEITDTYLHLLWHCVEGKKPPLLFIAFVTYHILYVDVDKATKSEMDEIKNILSS